MIKISKKVNNHNDYLIIYNILKNLFLSTFKWNNLPKEINKRYLEMTLFECGKLAFFYDENLGYTSLKMTSNGKLNVYYDYDKIRVYGANGYQKTLINHVDSVIIFNNIIRDTPQQRIMQYAKRIANLERTIDINVHAQRTPVTIKTSKKAEQSTKNAYMKYEEYSPVIITDDKMGDLRDVFQVLNSQAPFVSDKLYNLLKDTWNEALSYIGIDNNSSEKKERMLQDEIIVSNGLAIANRNTRLQARQEGISEINDLFNLNVDIELNNISLIQSNKEDTTLEEGEINV